MCKAISPVAFLAVAFRKAKTENITSDLLVQLKAQVNAATYSDGEDVGVVWNRDALDSDFSFYSPIFSMHHDRISCKLDLLEKYFDELTGDVDKTLVDFMESQMTIVSSKV